MEEYTINTERLSHDLKQSLYDFSLTDLSEAERGFEWNYVFNRGKYENS